jgi:hypothetical protein
VVGGFRKSSISFIFMESNIIITFTSSSLYIVVIWVFNLGQIEKGLNHSEYLRVTYLFRRGCRLSRDLGETKG